MSFSTDFDIAIIGGGITGLSAAFHLQKLGFSRLCLFSKEPEEGATTAAAGFIAGGLADNFTRLSHPRGEAFARDIWNFCDQAFDALLDHLRKTGLSHERGERLRWIISEPELVEARKAVAQLKAQGLEGSLSEGSHGSRAGISSQGLLGVQTDGLRAASVPVQALLDQLKAEAGITAFGEAQSFQSSGGPIEVQHAGGKVRAEFLIAAQHLRIGDLVPNLAEALVPYADQWSSTLR